MAAFFYACIGCEPIGIATLVAIIKVAAEAATPVGIATLVAIIKVAAEAATPIGIATLVAIVKAADKAATPVYIFTIFFVTLAPLVFRVIKYVPAGCVSNAMLWVLPL